MRARTKAILAVVAGASLGLAACGPVPSTGPAAAHEHAPSFARENIDQAKQVVTMAIQYSDGQGRGVAPVNVLAFAPKKK